MEPNNENSRILIRGGGYRNSAISLIRMLSMLMIISCHIMQYYDLELAWWFNVGVQIFLCISGFLYGQKNIDNVTDFYNKRLKKILIPYYLVFIPFGIIEFIFARDMFSIKDFAMGLVLCSTIKGAGHLWFIPTILMCYLITPLLQGYRDNYVNNKKTMALFAVLVFILSSILIQGFTNFYPAWVSCYTIGYALGINEKQGFISEKVLLIITGLVAAVGNAAQIYFDYVVDLYFKGFSLIKNYNHVMLGLFIFMLLRIVFERLNLNRIRRLLALSDEYSFEVYLVHQLLILGPFSLLSFTEIPLVNITVALSGVFILAALLKNVEIIIDKKMLESY